MKKHACSTWSTECGNSKVSSDRNQQTLIGKVSFFNQNTENCKAQIHFGQYFPYGVGKIQEYHEELQALAQLVERGKSKIVLVNYMNNSYIFNNRCARLNTI